MARKTKEELLEEARDLGVEAHEDENYNEISARVAAERERVGEREERVEEAKEELSEQVPLDPEKSDEKTTSGWNALGQWVGIKR